MHVPLMQSLKAQLDAECSVRMESAVLRAAYEQVVETLGHNGMLPQVIGVGARFPDFMLPNAEGQLISLAALLARGPVVVTFFRGGWCPYCKLMLDALAEALPEIEACGATLVALTPDTAGLPLAAKQAHHAKFEVLSDVDCGVGLAAGVVFRLPPLYRARLASVGIDIPRRHGNAAWFLPIPATFILKRDGVIAWRFANVDFTHRAEPADIIEALAKFTGQSR